MTILKYILQTNVIKSFFFSNCIYLRIMHIPTKTENYIYKYSLFRYLKKITSQCLLDFCYHY